MTSVLDEMYVEKSLIEPEVVFTSPKELVSSNSLTVAQKLDVLERWSRSLQDRIRATGEGMQPPAGQTADEAATIEAIGKAVKDLKTENCSS